MDPRPGLGSGHRASSKLRCRLPRRGRHLLWVDLDLEGYVEDLAPYAVNGSLTVERAKGRGGGTTAAHRGEHRAPHGGGPRRLQAPQRPDNRRPTRHPGPGERTRGRGGAQDLLQPLSRVGGGATAAKGDGRGMYVVSNWDLELAEVLEGLGGCTTSTASWSPRFRGSRSPIPGSSRRRSRSAV